MAKPTGSQRDGPVVGGGGWEGFREGVCLQQLTVGMHEE